MDKIPMPAKGAVGFTLVKAGVTHWHMRDLRLIRPQQMTTNHIMRCLRMVANHAATRRLVDLDARTAICLGIKLGPFKELRASRTEIQRAAWHREGLRFRLEYAALTPLGRQFLRVLLARHRKGETPIWKQIEGLTEAFVPSDYSGLALWSLSLPAK